MRVPTPRPASNPPIQSLPPTSRQSQQHAVRSPNKPRPADPLTIEIADMLRRIENNYYAEGSGPGSRFEGRLLEDAQAEAVLRRIREWGAKP